MSADTESHDDVAGLFKRLGRNDDSRQYHDFSAAPALSGKPAKVGTAPAPAPAPAPASEAASPVVAAAATVKTVAGTPTQAAVLPVVPAAAAVAGHSTALDALFRRLLEAPLRPSVQSPLARLRVR